MSRFFAPAACLITGLALYVTRGVLDQAVTPHGIERFAMLPPWQALVGFICLGGLVLLGIDHLNAPRGTTTFKRPRLGELVLPLFSLIVLLLPYLPIVPDRWPALQALAGPLGAIVWLCVAALQVWVLWQSRLITARPIEKWSLTAITVAIFLATATASGIAANRLTGTVLFPSGDEPHYLVMAQSLWRDGDLQIENNHKRGDYHEYFAPDLEPHYLTRGSNGQIYSIHPIGISVLLAPIYAFGGYQATVWTMILLASLATAMAWRWTVSMLNAPGAATFAWAVIAFSAPFLLNTFTIYPEISAAIAVMVAFTTTIKTNAARSGLAPWLAVGVCIAALPWLSTKYAPMSAALFLVVMFRLWNKKEPASLLRDPKVIAITAIYALSLLAWFAFFYVIWGKPSPTAPYGSLTQTEARFFARGGPGLFLDQEYGVFAFAPAYVLAFTGLWHMWRTGGELRRQAIEIAVIFSALLATVGAFGIWWGGSSSPARPITSGLLLFMLPIATAFRAAPVASARRAAQHLLLWVGVGIAITLVYAQGGLLIANDRDGAAALLEFWAPRWELWRLAPTFIEGTWLRSTLHAAWWLTVASAGAFALSRVRTTRAGLSALAAAGTLVTALLVIMVARPLIGGEVTGIDLSARARLTALDGYDARARPASLLYDPLHKGAAIDVLPQLVLGVRPGQRIDPQPVRVIHNGRFSLPAGTYTIAVQFTDRGLARPEPMSLQIGRNGPPMQTWTVEGHPRQLWQTTLWLPVDASFVGLRGSPELERAIASYTFTPTAVIDAGARPHIPIVLSAAMYPAANLYFHNEQTYPEVQGFWTRGNQATQFTVATPPGQREPVVLRFHPGPKPNTTTISTFGWERHFTLTPGQATEVELPTFASGVVPVTITAEGGFFPRDFDPTSTDRRFLGLWVEVKKGTP